MTAKERFLARAVSVGAFALALLLTIVQPDWVELGFRTAPDHDDGGFEWIIVIFLGLAMLACCFLPAAIGGSAAGEARRPHAARKEDGASRVTGNLRNVE